MLCIFGPGWTPLGSEIKSEPDQLNPCRIVFDHRQIELGIRVEVRGPIRLTRGPHGLWTNYCLHCIELMIINEMKCINFPFVKKKNFGIIGLTLCLVLFLPFLSNRNKSQQNKIPPLHLCRHNSTLPAAAANQIKW
jgi:hypothetical protein